METTQIGVEVIGTLLLEEDVSVLLRIIHVAPGILYTNLAPINRRRWNDDDEDIYMENQYNQIDNHHLHSYRRVSI